MAEEMAVLDDSLANSLSDQILAIKSFYGEELERQFRDLGNYSEDSIAEWRRVSNPLVREAQRLTADIANAVIDLQLQELLGDFSASYPPYGLVTGPAIRNGSSVQDVYDRAFKPVWRALGNGYPIDVAVDHGISRLDATFDVDIERVVDHVAIERFANENRIIGYRRVLNGVHNCALCILASTQLYRKKDLKGIHPRCKCKVLPVLSFENISTTLRQDLIEQVHASIQERYGLSDRAGRQLDYRKIIIVRNHGELGPVLTFRNHHFTGPSGLKTPGE